MENEITINGEVYIKKSTILPTIFEYCKLNHCWAILSPSGSWYRSSVRGDSTDLEALKTVSRIDNVLVPEDLHNDNRQGYGTITPNGLYLIEDLEYNRPNYKEGDPILVWVTNAEYANVRIFKEWRKDSVSKLVAYNGYDSVRGSLFEWDYNHPYSFKLLMTPIKLWPKE